MFLSNGNYHVFPIYLDIIGVIFHVRFNYKYGKHINTCETTFFVREPIARILLSF